MVDKLTLLVGNRERFPGRVEVVLSRNGELRATRLLWGREISARTVIGADEAAGLLDTSAASLADTTTGSQMSAMDCESVYRFLLLVAGKPVLEAALPERLVVASCTLSAVLRRLHEAANRAPASPERETVPVPSETSSATHAR